MPDWGALGVSSSAQISATAPGRVVNQDAVGRWTPDLMTTRARMGVLYVVADGVGPRDSGQIASQTAVDTVIETYRREFDGSPVAALERGVRQAGRAILDQVEADASLRGMASTCTAAVVRNSRLVVGHVGDSRAYLMRHGRVRQLTQDHTWASERRTNLDTAQPHLDQALKAAPTRLLGSARDVAVDLIEEPLEDGDVIILCTDGLTATLDDAAIARAVEGEDARGAADRLIRTARTTGSSDDISVTVLVIEPVVQPTGVVDPAPREHAHSPASTAKAHPTWSTPTALVGMGVLAVLLAGVSAMWLYQLIFADRIYPGVHALGADLGGRSSDEAARALETQFAEYARQPITLEVAGQQFFLTAGELGVRFDAQATANGALQIGRSGTIVRQLFEQARGLAIGRDAPLVYQVDDSRMQAALNPLAQRVESTSGAAQDAALLIEPSGLIRVQPSRTGRTLDRAASSAVIRERLQALGAGTLRLPTAEIPPNVSEGDLVAPRTAAERLLAQPLTVTAAGESIQLDRVQLASILSVRKEQLGGRTQVSLHLLDGETSRLLQPLADRVTRPPVHARFNWSPSGLTVMLPGRDGQELDLSTAADVLEEQVLNQAGPAVLTLRPVHALGQEDAASLNIRELVIDAALPLGGADQWTRANTAHVMGEVHGRLVLPGQAFSLLEALGPVRVERGYQAAPDDSPVIARGLNFAATALIQAVFWSGYRIEERQAPSYWTARAGSSPRGVVGLDAALDPELHRDLRFTNDGQQPLLIQAGVVNDAAVIGLYGARPSWNVQVSDPTITGMVSPDGDPERREDASTPVGQDVWLDDRSDGFSVSLQRNVVTSADTSPRVLNLTSTYAPNRGRLLAGAKPPE